MKEIAFFDLDDTLWKMEDQDIWIIDKDKPYKPVMSIDHIEYNNIKNKRYIKDNIIFDYNGNKFYIRKDMFEIIKKKSGSENPERFGISFMPITKKSLLDKNNFEFLVDNISHLRKNKFVEIGILTARSNQKNHAELLNKLRLEMSNIGLDIKKIFFIGNGLTKGYSYYDKTRVLLEHLIGFKILDGKFTDKKQDWYPRVSFYDDDIKNIEYANDIQIYLNDLLRKTDDDLFKIIYNRIKENDLKLETYLITGNKLNKFKKNVVSLQEPIRFPIQEKLNHLKSYESY